MDNRTLLEKLSKDFSTENLTGFLHVASGKFRPQRDDYRQYLPGDSGILSLSKGVDRL